MNIMGCIFLTNNFIYEWQTFFRVKFLGIRITKEYLLDFLDNKIPCYINPEQHAVSTIFKTLECHS